MLASVHALTVWNSQMLTTRVIGLEYRRTTYLLWEGMYVMRSFLSLVETVGGGCSHDIPASPHSLASQPSQLKPTAATLWGSSFWTKGQEIIWSCSCVSVAFFLGHSHPEAASGLVQDSMAVTIALLQWSLEKPHMKQVGQLSVYKASNSMHLMHNDKT